MYDANWEYLFILSFFCFAGTSRLDMSVSSGHTNEKGTGICSGSRSQGSKYGKFQKSFEVVARLSILSRYEHLFPICICVRYTLFM